MYSKYANFILLFSAISLLIIGWFGLWLPFMLFFAFVPLLLLAVKYKKHEISLLKYWVLVYLVMLVWNVVITYWICNFFVVAGVAAFLINAFFMSIPFVLFAILYVKATNSIYPLFAFVFYWLCFEYIHLNWEFSWPWLTLGHAFAKNISYVQWYEYTGVLGGSLWILLGNIFFFLIYIKIIRSKRQMIYCFALLLAPILLSFIMEKNIKYQIGKKN